MMKFNKQIIYSSQNEFYVALCYTTVEGLSWALNLF